MGQCGQDTSMERKGDVGLCVGGGGGGRWGGSPHVNSSPFSSKHIHVHVTSLPPLPPTYRVSAGLGGIAWTSPLPFFFVIPYYYFCCCLLYNVTKKPELTLQPDQ